MKYHRNNRFTGFDHAAIRLFETHKQACERALATAAFTNDGERFALTNFKINAPNGDKVLEVTLRNAVSSFQFAVDPKALQHAADYMQRSGQISQKVDTAPLLAAP